MGLKRTFQEITKKKLSLSVKFKLYFVFCRIFVPKRVPSRSNVFLSVLRNIEGKTFRVIRSFYRIDTT